MKYATACWMRRAGCSQGHWDLRECGRGRSREAISLARLFRAVRTISTLRGQTGFGAGFFRLSQASGMEKHCFRADRCNHLRRWRKFSPPPSWRIIAATSWESARLACVRQKLITMDDGAALILTVANYYNPGGNRFWKEGITPTEIVRRRSGRFGFPAMTMRRRHRKRRKNRALPAAPFARGSDLPPGVGPLENSCKKGRVVFRGLLGRSESSYSLLSTDTQANLARLFPRLLFSCFPGWAPLAVRSRSPPPRAGKIHAITRELAAAAKWAAPTGSEIRVAFQAPGANGGVTDRLDNTFFDRSGLRYTDSSCETAAVLEFRSDPSWP